MERSSDPPRGEAARASTPTGPDSRTSSSEGLRDQLRHLEASRDTLARRYQWAPVPYLILDRRGQILEANAACATLLALPEPSLPGRSFSEFVASADRSVWRERLAVLTDSGAEVRLGIELERGDGVPISALLLANGATSAELGGKIRLVLLEGAARAGVPEGASPAVLREAMVELRERRRLAEELHDDVAQTLSLVSMRLDALADELGKSPADAMIPRVREIAELTTSARERVSSLSFQLSPTVLYAVGLVGATEWLADEIQRIYGLRVHVHPHPEIEDLDETARGVLFRALREFLVNAAKHSDAHHAEVRIARDADRVVVDVEDGGVGFDPNTVEAGFGLLSVRERIGRLGGRVRVYSQPGDGTHVEISLPVELAPTSRPAR